MRSSCARCARSRSIATARSNSSPPTSGAICRANRCWPARATGSTTRSASCGAMRSASPPAARSSSSSSPSRSSMSIQTQRIADERDRAAQESQRAETVSKFMLNVFSAADPVNEQGRGDHGPRAAGSGRTTDPRRPGQHPEVRARLLEAVGQAFRRQGHFERSISYLEDALRLRKQISGSSGDGTAERARRTRGRAATGRRPGRLGPHAASRRWRSPSSIAASARRPTRAC